MTAQHKHASRDSTRVNGPGIQGNGAYHTGDWEIGFNLRTALAALWVFAGYYLGARLGFALTFQPHKVSVMWPPNSILMATLLLTPVRTWGFLLLCAFPAHLLAELQSSVPPGMVLCWFVSNCAEALIGATLIRFLVGAPFQFDRLRQVGIFFLCGSFLGPLVSSFIDAGFVTLNRWGQEGYWQVWRIRFFSNVFTSIVLVPVIVAWFTDRTMPWRRASRARMVEASLLMLGLVTVCIGVFYQFEPGSGLTPMLMYVPLPFLLWAAVRFGLRGASAAILTVALTAIWGAIHGHGPFSVDSAGENAMSIQMFMVVVSITLLPLTAVLRERRQAESELRASEERYREVVDTQTDLVCRYTVDTTLTFVNDEYCRFFGRTREELLGRSFLNLFPPVAHDKMRSNIQMLIHDRRPLTCEHEMVLPNGKTSCYQWVNYVVTDADGQVREIQAIARDITDRHQAERALRLSEERNRAMLQAIPDLIFVLSRDGVFRDYNAKDPRTLFAPPDKFLGRNMRDVLPPGLATQLQGHIDRLFATGESQFVEYTLPISGQMCVYETRLVRIGDDKVLSVVRDITDRQRAEEALRESEKRFRTMADSAPVMIWMSGTDRLCTYLSQGWLDFTGRQLEEELASGWTEGIHREDRERCMSAYAAAFDKRLPFKMEYRLRRRDGEYRWIVDQGIPRFAPTDEFLGYIGSALDITERKLAESALKVSEERYREVVESQTDMVCRYLPDTTLTFVNEAYCRFFGRRREELIGRRFLELIPQSAWGDVMEHVASLSRERRTIVQEHEALLPDGRTGWQHWVDYAIFGPDGSVIEFQGIGRDITDRKRAEEARQNLAHASRLAVVGELTAMIAHEVNQPLGAILSNADAAEILLESKKPPLDEIRQILIDIRSNDLRASEAIRRIRALLQKREMEMQPLDINEIVADVLRLVTGDALRRRVQIQKDFAADLPSIRGDRVHLQQVLLNLIVNSMDAMAEMSETTRQIGVRTTLNGDNTVEVAVTDVGPGIPANKLSRVFDSFFTTKKDGMGLGLSIARSIIEAHHGRIWAENNSACGATFRFTLPFEREFVKDKAGQATAAV